MRLLPFEYAVRNLGRSPLRLVASVLGGLLVVSLVLAAGGFVRGMEQSLAVSGSRDNVILLLAGSEESIERSQLNQNVPSLAAASISGLRQRLGEAYVSPEVHMALLVRTAADDPVERQAVLRGVTPAAFLVHPQVRITAGRAPAVGAYELLVGDLAATRLGLPAEALAIGKTLWFDNRAWTVVGHHSAPHTVMDAEIWLPLPDLQVATKRDNLSCVILTLGTATFKDVATWCARRLDLELVAVRESDYYASLARFYSPVRAMVWATAILIALGGIFGGLNTMYAAFAARVRELGTLQTLGYSRTAIVVSLLQESLLAMAAGGLVAAVIGLFVLNGIAVKFSMGAFALAVDAPVMIGGLLAGLALAVIGVIPPAWRCLRLPIVEALRAS